MYDLTTHAPDGPTNFMARCTCAVISGDACRDSTAKLIKPIGARFGHGEATCRRHASDALWRAIEAVERPPVPGPPADLEAAT